jgi:hypothetical protein
MIGLPDPPCFGTLLELPNLLLSAGHIIATIMFGLRSTGDDGGGGESCKGAFSRASSPVPKSAYKESPFRTGKTIILPFTPLCEKGTKLYPIETAGWLSQAPPRSLGVLTRGKAVLLSSIDHKLMITSSPENAPVKTPGEVPYHEKRKGSVFADLSRRKESVAALTENVTGE